MSLTGKNLGDDECAELVVNNISSNQHQKFDIDN